MGRGKVSFSGGESKFFFRTSLSRRGLLSLSPPLSLSDRCTHGIVVEQIAREIAAPVREGIIRRFLLNSHLSPLRANSSPSMALICLAGRQPGKLQTSRAI